MNDDADRPATQRWWLNPALAQLAFAQETRGVSGTGTSAAAAVEHALLHAGLGALDLDDPTQRDFGDYELQEQIGQGGMGLVYRARQRGLEREVAIKLLSAGHMAPEQLVSDLRREARQAARLQHPNIVVIHEMGEAMGLIYYAMQLVRGQSLSQRIERDGRFPPERAARLVRCIAEAVHYAHGMGMLHLDLKPANILLDEHDMPLVADFGLARSVEQPPVNESVCGTPSYMAPEQARLDGTPLTPATDVWGMGAILYELLSGTPPFEGVDAQATLRLLDEGQVRRPTRAGPVPPDLEAICLHCLERDPRRRYSTARALAVDLGRFLDNRPVSVRPLSPAQRVVRWARREPRAAVAFAALLVGLLAGLVAMSPLWTR